MLGWLPSIPSHFFNYARTTRVGAIIDGQMGEGTISNPGRFNGLLCGAGSEIQQRVDDTAVQVL